MYSESERDGLLSHLTGISGAIEGIQGLILVGSGAYGYRDPYSDLDVVIVVKDSNDVPIVHDEMVGAIGRSRVVLKHKVYRHEPDIFVSCFLLDDYLELDLGVWSFEKLRATKSNWRVLYDKNSPSIEERLRSTIPSNHGNLEQTARDSLGFMWQFIRGASVAFSRRNPIKAFKEIEAIRDKIAELIALREGIHHDAAKEIGKVKSGRALGLIETYFGTMNQEGIYATFVATVELYFELVSEILGHEQIVEDYKIAKDMIAALTEHS